MALADPSLKICETSHICLTISPSSGIYANIDTISVNNCPKDIAAFTITCYDYLGSSKISESLAVQVNDCFNVYMITPVASPAKIEETFMPSNFQSTMSLTNVFTHDPNCAVPTVSGSSTVTCWIVENDACISLTGATVVGGIDTLDIKGDLTLRFFQCPETVSFKVECDDIYTDGNTVTSNIVEANIIDCTQIFSV
jgi:hypothetical protein